MLTVFCFGYAIRIHELPFAIYRDPYYSQRTSTEQEIDFLYFTIITLTTVGYGDMSPVSIIGKILVLFAAIISATIISLVVVVMTNMLGLSKEHKLVMREIHI